MKTWRRSEPREVRPFFKVWDLEETLRAARLVVAGEEIDSETDVVPLDPEAFQNLEVVLRPKMDADLLADRLGDRSERVSLVLTIRDPMFKRRILQESWNILEGAPEEYALGADLVGKFGHGRELQITLALALDGDLDAEPGWPHIRGQWIAKRRFVIKLRSIQSIFALKPMSLEKAQELTGSKRALVGVEYYDGLLAEEAGEDTSIATCYIAEDVYNKMLGSTSSSSLQTIALSEIVYSLLTAAKGDVLEIIEFEKGAPIERILRMLGVNNHPMTLEDLKKLIESPLRLHAAIQDRVGVVAAMKVI